MATRAPIGLKRKFYTIRDSRDKMVAEILALQVIKLIDYTYEIDLGVDIPPARVTLPDGFTIREMA